MKLNYLQSNEEEGGQWKNKGDIQEWIEGWRWRKYSLSALQWRPLKAEGSRDISAPIGEGEWSLGSSIVGSVKGDVCFLAFRAMDRTADAPDWQSSYNQQIMQTVNQIQHTAHNLNYSSRSRGDSLVWMKPSMPHLALQNMYWYEFLLTNEVIKCVIWFYLLKIKLYFCWN